MGCTIEKELKNKNDACESPTMDMKSDDNRMRSTGTEDEHQFLLDMKDHYILGQIQKELNDKTSFLLDKNINDTQIQSKSLCNNNQSFEQDFLIGQFLNMESIEVKGRRSKSFNPNDKWKKTVKDYKKYHTNDQYNFSKQLLKIQFQEKYLSEYYEQNKKKFNKKLKIGPTQDIRWQSWNTKLLNEKEYKDFFKFNVNNLYEFLLIPFALEDQDAFYSNNMKLIVKDVTRTFPEMDYFENMGQDQLKRTLLATSNFLKSIGYCQGMNFIMGMLLLVSGGDESKSFNSFISLSFRKEFMLVGLFDNGFPLLKFLEFLFEHQFKIYLPLLFQHFKNQELENTAWLTKWLLTLYLYSFPLNISIRIMDYMISSNIFGLIYVAIQILSILEKHLLNMDGIEIMNLFQRKKNSSVSNDGEAQKTLKQINIDEIIKYADVIALTDKQIRKLARDFKQSVANEYRQLIDNENSNNSDKEHEMMMQSYALELSNITFFVHYFTLYGKKQQQLEYLEVIKNKYINKDVINQNQQKQQPI